MSDVLFSIQPCGSSFIATTTSWNEQAFDSFSKQLIFSSVVVEDVRSAKNEMVLDTRNRVNAVLRLSFLMHEENAGSRTTRNERKDSERFKKHLGWK